MSGEVGGKCLDLREQMCILTDDQNREPGRLVVIKPRIHPPKVNRVLHGLIVVPRGHDEGLIRW